MAPHEGAKSPLILVLDIAGKKVSVRGPLVPRARNDADDIQEPFPRPLPHGVLTSEGIIYQYLYAHGRTTTPGMDSTIAAMASKVDG
jgi:hypothetical protein